MRTRFAFVVCLMSVFVAGRILAYSSYSEFEMSVRCDEKMNALVNQIRQNMVTGCPAHLPEDPTSAAAIDFHHKVLSGIPKQTDSKIATPPNVFEFTFKSEAGARLRWLGFRPNNGQWSGNALRDDVTDESLNENGLSIDIRGTSDATGLPELKSVSAMVHNMNGQPEHGRISYVEVPTGVSRCDSVYLKLHFIGGSFLTYKFDGTRASFTIYKDKLLRYVGMDEKCNLCYETLLPE